MRRKFFSILLSLAMVITMMPAMTVMSLAEETGVAPAPTVSASNDVSVLMLKATKSGSKYVKLSWNKVSGATKYKVYGNIKGKKLKNLATLKSSKKSYTVKKIKGTKLKAHKVYKFYVQAYKGKKKLTKLAKSRTIAFVTAKTMGKYANPTKITASETDCTVAVGSTKQLTATVTMPKGKKHLSSKYGTKLIYKSNNPSVATVDSKGIVTGVSVGDAKIYIQDLSGLYCTTTVKVLSQDEVTFNTYKQEVLTKCDALLKSDSTDAQKTLVANAKTKINNLQFDSSKSLAENKAAVDSIYNELSSSLNEPGTGGGGDNPPGPTPPEPTTYTVTYDVNGATTGTAPTAQTKNKDVALTLATNTGNLVKDNYVFNGWNTSADGSGTHYDEGASYTSNADLTLYAEWAKTVADVLATVDGFPEFDTGVPANAWARDGQGKMCIYNGSLCIFRDIYYFYTKVELNTVLTKGTNTWTCTNEYGETFTFNMDESVLTSVTLSGYTGVDPEINDTYAPIKMPQKGDLITLSSDTTHQYRVLSADGTKAFVMSMYDVSGTKKAYDADGAKSDKNLLAYADSDIDKYLEETWYAGLDNTMKDAIESTTIDQPAYEFAETQPVSGDYYSGTYDFESPTNYYIVPDGTKTATVGSRHAYLLDVKDVINYLGTGNLTPTNVNEMFFDTDSSVEESKKCWLRSASAELETDFLAWFVSGEYGAMSIDSYDFTYEARAAFTIDLSKVDYDIVHTVKFDMCDVTGNAPESRTVVHGSKVTKPTDPTTESGLTFKGWYKTKDATTGALSDPWNFETDKVTSDITLYAKWVITLDDFMSTQASFPSTLDGSWKNDDSWALCYCYYGGCYSLCFGNAGYGPEGSLANGEGEMTKVSGGYLLPVATEYVSYTITFNMCGDTITNIVVSNSFGTFYPVPVW